MSEEAVLEKRKPGRPPGRKVKMALAAASQAAISISEMDSVVAQMKEHQKIMFESIMSGDDELIAGLKSGHTEWFTHIAKGVKDKEGNYVPTSKVTLENVHDLDTESYQRLVRICAAHVRQHMGNEDYRQYTDPLKEYIKKFAPMALGTVVSLARDGLKEETRLKAAKDILDRAGEAASEPEKDIIIPVQVNIMLTGEDGKVVSYGNTER
jgi:hypothetical protein